MERLICLTEDEYATLIKDLNIYKEMYAKVRFGIEVDIGGSNESIYVKGYNNIRIKRSLLEDILGISLEDQVNNIRIV